MSGIYTTPAGQKVHGDGKPVGHPPEPSEDSQRMVRHTVAARVASMESEKLYLQNLHGDISRMRLAIGDRIAALERQIAAEKASVPNDQAER